MSFIGFIILIPGFLYVIISLKVTVSKKSNKLMIGKAGVN